MPGIYPRCKFYAGVVPDQHLTRTLESPRRQHPDCHRSERRNATKFPAFQFRRRKRTNRESDPRGEGFLSGALTGHITNGLSRIEMGLALCNSTSFALALCPPPWFARSCLQCAPIDGNSMQTGAGSRGPSQILRIETWAASSPSARPPSRARTSGELFWIG